MNGETLSVGASRIQFPIGLKGALGARQQKLLFRRRMAVVALQTVLVLRSKVHGIWPMAFAQTMCLSGTAL